MGLVIKNGVLLYYGEERVGEQSVVTVPEGVTEIAENAFHHTGMGCVVLPSTLRVIGKKAFYCCRNLTEVIMPEHLELIIGEYAFEECRDLREMRIPEGVTEIPQGLFLHCERMETLYLPRSLTKISRIGTFYGCHFLEHIFFAGTKTELKSIENGFENAVCTGYDESERNDPAGFVIRDGVLVRYEGLESTVIVPDGVHTIGEGAFGGWFRENYLYRLILPEGVTTFEDDAIFSTEYLTEIVIPKSLKKIPPYSMSSTFRPKKIIYKGTKAEWAEIKDEMYIIDIDVVECTDGIFSQNEKA